MKAPVVLLKIRIRLPDGSRPFLDPVLSSNGKLKPLYAIVDGKPEHHPNGTYFLRYAVLGGKRVYKPISKGADPLTELQKRQKGLDAQAAGVVLAEQEPERRTPSRPPSLNTLRR